jgi:hypothetical protein
MPATVDAYAHLSEEEIEFYRHSLRIMKDAGVPHLVGGAYAFARYTGITRHTKDFDVFIKRADFARTMDAFKKAGYRSELTFEHWIGKAFKGDYFVDLIYSAGNAVAEVDDLWFEHAIPEEVFGVKVDLIPAEEMIWSKGLIMERERFDGADVNHVLHAMGPKLDWKRLLDRYGKYWRGLYAHLILFGFVYPAKRSNIPEWVMTELAQRLLDETNRGDSAEKTCYGTIISRQQYLIDIAEWGYEDARRREHGGKMSDHEIAAWTKGIEIDGAK